MTGKLWGARRCGRKLRKYLGEISRSEFANVWELFPILPRVSRISLATRKNKIRENLVDGQQPAKLSKCRSNSAVSKFLQLRGEQQTSTGKISWKISSIRTGNHFGKWRILVKTEISNRKYKRRIHWCIVIMNFEKSIWINSIEYTISLFKETFTYLYKKTSQQPNLRNVSQVLHLNASSIQNEMEKKPWEGKYSLELSSSTFKLLPYLD